MDFEAALESAGSFGRAQFVPLSLSCFISACGGWQAYITIFTAIDTDFYCSRQNNISSAPFDAILEVTETKNSSVYDDVCVVKCSKYVYDTEFSSIVTDFDLGCGAQQYLVSFSISAYWVSYFISCLVNGYLTDRFGRKWVTFVNTVLLAIVSVITPISPTIYIYTVCRFFTGFFVSGSILVYTTLVESVDKNRVSFIGVTNQVIYASGEFSATLVGYLFKHSWRTQMLISSVPIYIYILANIFLMPESARWLHSQQKFSKSEKTLKWIAKVNGRDPACVRLDSREQGSFSHGFERNSNSSVTSLVETETKAVHQAVSAISLFQTLPGALLTFSNMFAWFGCCMISFGITFNVQNISGDVYINSILLSSCEIIAWTVTIFMNKFGRKTTFCVSLFISGVSCAVVPFTQDLLHGKVQIVFAMIAKCLISGCFDLLFVYSPEQFPTVLRSSGLTLCSASARVALIVAPFILELDVGPYNCCAFVIFAAFGLAACLVTAVVGVETKGKPFITTVHEFHSVARNRKIQQSVHHQ